jgi:hypothetical protein
MMAFRLLRPTVMGLAVHVGVPECIDEVVAVFKNWITNISSVPKPHPDLRSIVYSYGTYVKSVTEPPFCCHILSADSITIFQK